MFKRITRSGGVLIEYPMNFLNASRWQGEYNLHQDQWKNVSSLTLMSKGEKWRVKESSLKCLSNRGEYECRMQMVECRTVKSECKCCHQCQRGRLLANSVDRMQWMLVIDDNSEDSRIRNLNVKLRRNSMEEDAHKSSRYRSLLRRRKMVTIGSHTNFPKEREPSDLQKLRRG